MEVIVPIGHGGFAIESNAHGGVVVIRQGQGDGLTGSGNLVKNPFVAGLVAPDEGVARIPRDTIVSGDQHHKLVIGLPRRIGDGCRTVMARKGHVEGQNWQREARQVYGGAHQPMVAVSAGDVETGVPATEGIGIAESPARVRNGQGGVQDSAIPRPAVGHGGGHSETFEVRDRENAAVSGECGDAEAVDQRVGTYGSHIPLVVSVRHKSAKNAGSTGQRRRGCLRPRGGTGNPVEEDVCVCVAVPAQFGGGVRQCVDRQTIRQSARGSQFHRDII